jgi:putative two-component system response regulator
MNDPSYGGIDPVFLKTLTVLYVEDEEEIRELLSRFLRRWVGTLNVAENGQQGLEAYRAQRPDVLVTDIRMPVMDGLDMAAAIRDEDGDVPIIVITAYSERDYFMRSIEIGVDKYVVKPVDTDLLLKAIYRGAAVRAQTQTLEMTKQRLLDSLGQTVGVLSRAIEMRDPYTDGHQKRVSQLAVGIGESMGLPSDQVTGLRLGGLIHDIGKIRIPAEMLATPRRLSALEFDIIKTHPIVGAEILSQTEFPWPVKEMVAQHHERLNGTGYPYGLKTDDLCLDVRIISVADVVEAMYSHRPYRPGMGMPAALEEIRKNRGILYDPDVVDHCLRLLEHKGGDFWS